MISDARLLRGMLHTCEDIAEFIAPGYDCFVSSRLHQAAVIYKLQLIGEAAKLLSPELKLAHPGFPWSLFIRERNRLVHCSIVWN